VRPNAPVSKGLNEGVDVPEAKTAVGLGSNADAREYVQRLGRVLRKRGNAQTLLYKVVARKTVDERIARRRKLRRVWTILNPRIYSADLPGSSNTEAGRNRLGE
jgi:superfamily II DNA or RNA helicase